MRVTRCFFAATFSVDKQIELSKPLSHYLTNVLRLKEQTNLLLFNGDGFDYSAKITHANKHKTQVLITDKQKNNTESTLATHLFQCVSKGERMDYSLQKSVELGITEITPVFSEYCEVHLKGERLAKRMQHWHGVITSACEQSGRAVIPKLNSAISFGQLPKEPSEINLIFEPKASNNILQNSPESVSFIIGPEGGFSTEELKYCRQQGFTNMPLGPRILRTETASVAALSYLQTRWGDYN